MSVFAARNWQLAHGRSLQLGLTAQIMGILNVTPDSFSDGGKFVDPAHAVSRAIEMMEEGASIIDIGGESTKPGADPINGDTERERVIPIIEQISRTTDALVSIDTYRAETALAAVEAGAHIVNDVWGCQRDPEIADVAARTGAGLVIMNTRRERDTLPDLIEDAQAFLNKSLAIAEKAGVENQCIAVDPGFGFAITIDHDIPILNRLEGLHRLGLPILVGTSRKRFLGSLTGRDAEHRAAATAATSVVARMKGAAIFRVHDIPENKDALAVADALILDGSNP